MTTLDQIGLKYGTDKASHGHGYLNIYEREIVQATEMRRGDLLELGWWKGESMRMWREWLPEWSITGLDIESKDPIPGVNFTMGSQADPGVIQDMAEWHGPWDVIVDDASHVSPLTIKSFRLLWPHVKPGGLYFVEDLQVSYHSDWAGHPDPDSRGTIMHFLKGLTDSIHHGHATVYQNPPPIYTDVEHVAFWPGLCMIEKTR